MTDQTHAYSKANILEILGKNLTNESMCFLIVLDEENRPLYKDELRDLTNKMFKMIDDEGKSSELLIKSRHSLDIHTARLEGAGLVEVKTAGRIRLYELSNIGRELIEYIKQNRK